MTRHIFKQYAIGVFAISVGFALRFVLGEALGTSVPYVTLYPAVVFAIWFGGQGPGMLAAALGVIAVFVFYTSGIGHPADWVRAAIFAAFAITFNAVNERFRRARAAAERDRDLLRTTLASIGDAVIATDAAGKVTFLNVVAEGLTGWRSADAVGKPIVDIFEIRDGGVLRSKDGRDIPIEDSAAPISGAQGQILGAVLVFRDVTERRRSEEALRQQWHTFDTALSNTPDFNYIFDLEGRFTYVNRARLHMFQRTAEEVLGKSYLELTFYPKELAERFHEQILRVIRTKEPIRAQSPFMAPDGLTREYEYIFVPVLSSEGAVEAVAGTTHDITEQKFAEAELRESNEQLKRANRELEEFAYVASHDLQEPLRMVNIYTQLILKDLPQDGTDLATYAGFVQDGVKRMVVLIHDLLTFSRTVHSEGTATGTADLRASLKEALSVLKDRIEGSGSVVEAGDLPTVHGETGQIAHVFQNLISNAIKYRKSGEPAHVQVSAVREGDFYRVTVQDDGIGFDPQYAERIFGLFKRLHKEEYPGTGLGLAICKRIVERYGGRIWAESRPGEGAAFHFLLRAAPPGHL